LAADDEPGFAVCDICFKAIKDEPSHDYFAAVTVMQHQNIAVTVPEDGNTGVEYFDKIKCDRCGKPTGLISGWGGRCTHCRDTLCIECAESWHEPCDYICTRCSNEKSDKAIEKSTELQWTKTPPTDKDAGKWFVYRYPAHGVPKTAELTFSHEVNRKLVLGMELEKLVTLGYEFFGPLPY